MLESNLHLDFPLEAALVGVGEGPVTRVFQLFFPLSVCEAQDQGNMMGTHKRR